MEVPKFLVILFLVLYFVFAGSHVLVQSSKLAERRAVWVVAGGKAELPCPKDPNLSHDTVALVLWYRTSTSVPIYSFDARESTFPDGERWHDENALGHRAFFRAHSNPPALIFTPTTAHDQGVYTCRVDYRESSSTTVLVNLTVVVPPGPPSVIWRGESVVGSVGPLEEGEKTQLTCSSSGGRPSPTLTWYQGNKRLPLTSVNSTHEPVSDTYTAAATLTLMSTRELLGVTLTCHAHIPRRHHAHEKEEEDRRLVVQPRTASVTLNITLPPTEVRILSSGMPSRAGTTLQLVCRAAGSHPPAQLTWWREHNRLSNVVYGIEDAGNITTATLTIEVNRHHDGAHLSCSGANPALRNSPLTDTATLAVFYPPVVGLSLGAAMKPEHIQEGVEVYFKCNIEANPRFHHVTWHHNNVEMVHNMSGGVQMNGQNLIVRELTRADSGSYTCTAANVEGRTVSNSVHLAVRHAPFCAGSEHERTQGAARGSTAVMKCFVEAEPPRGLTWTWIRKRVDGSEEELPQENISNDGVTSSILVTPNTLEEYGRFLCRASNSVGSQTSACVVNLVPAGPPDIPHNCSVTQGKPAQHLDTASLSINCLEGFDGGLPQQFQLETRQNGVLVSNMTSEYPEWVVGGLRAGVRVGLSVVAFNARGRSEALTLEVHTTSAQQHAAPDSKNTVSVPPIVGAALGLVAVVLLLIVVALIICRRMRPRPQKPTTAEIPLSPTTGGDNFDPDVVASIQRAAHSIDVIPSDQEDELDDGRSYDLEHLQGEQDEHPHTSRHACVYLHKLRDTHSSRDCESFDSGSCSCVHRRGNRNVGHPRHASLEDNTDREDVAINDSQSYDSGVSESESDSELREQDAGGQVRAIIRQNPDSSRAYVTLSLGDALAQVSPDVQLRLVPSDYAGISAQPSVALESKEPSPVEVRLRPFVSKEYVVSPDAVEEMRLMPSACRELRLVPSVTREIRSARTSLADVRPPSTRDLCSDLNASLSSRPPSSCAITSPLSQREVICLPISPGESPRPHLASREMRQRTPLAQASKKTHPMSTKDVRYIPTAKETGRQEFLDQSEPGQSVTLVQDERGEIFLLSRSTSKPENIRAGKPCTPVFPSVKVSDAPQKHQTPPPTHSVTLPKSVAKESKARALKKAREKEKLGSDSNRMLPSTPLLTPEEKTTILPAGRKRFQTRPHPDVCRRESSV